MTRMQLGLALIAGAVFTACCPKPPEAPQPVKGCPPGRPPADETELTACLQSLEFDSDEEAGDEQPLAVIAKGPGERCPGDPRGVYNCRYGPRARIEPAIGADRYSEEDLRQGRIIARLSLLRGETEEYPKFGLKPGRLTYWWVQTDASGTGGKSVFVTATSKGGRVEGPEPRPLIREIYREGTRLVGAVARWLWTLEDETSQGRCGAATCK